MKKIILPLILTLMLLAVAVNAAPSFPLVISGHIKNEGALYGFEVTLTNVNTGESLVQTTNDGGHFLFDVSNIKGGIRDGDIFEVEVLEHKITIDDFNYDTYAPYEISFDFHDIECPKCEVCEKCPACPEDVTPYDECDSCCPTIEEQLPYFCPEIDELCQSEFEEKCKLICEELPQPEDYDWAWYVIVGILCSSGATAFLLKNRIGLSYNTGFKIYKGRNGEEIKVHKHPAIRGYHNPNTQHQDINIRHPRGQLICKYEKVDDRWLYKE